MAPFGQALEPEVGLGGHLGRGVAPHGIPNGSQRWHRFGNDFSLISRGGPGDPRIRSSSQGEADNPVWGA